VVPTMPPSLSTSLQPCSCSPAGPGLRALPFHLPYSAPAAASLARRATQAVAYRLTLGYRDCPNAPWHGCPQSCVAAYLGFSNVQRLHPPSESPPTGASLGYIRAICPWPVTHASTSPPPSRPRPAPPPTQFNHSQPCPPCTPARPFSVIPCPGSHPWPQEGRKGTLHGGRHPDQID
jgi:hypothetical protein